MLHGTGLNNADNRRVTSAHLLASRDNHVPAPAFIPLSGPVGQNQLPEVSFVVKHEETRAAYEGPHTVGMPSQRVKPPTVLQSHPASSLPAPAHPQQQTQPSSHQLEEQFIKGLPPAFMELDAATQVQILALVDAGVDVDAEQKTNTEQKSTVAVKSGVKVASKSESKVAAAESESSVNESELAAAADSLNALAALQKESHVPFAKLVHLLAKGHQ